MRSRQILYPLDDDLSQSFIRNRKDLWKDIKTKLMRVLTASPPWGPRAVVGQVDEFVGTLDVNFARDVVEMCGLCAPLPYISGK